MTKKIRLISLICVAALCVAVLIATIVVLVQCSGDKGGTSIHVVVNGQRQEDGGVYDAVTGRTYNITAKADDQSVSARYTVAGSDPVELTGELFTPQTAGEYSFSFTADKHEPFSLTFAAVQSDDKLETITIAFVLGDHAAEGAACPEQLQLVEGAALSLPKAPDAREGYHFVGWSDGTSVYGAGAQYAVHADVTFTAVWEARLHTIAFAAGEHAAVGASLPDGYSVGYGTRINLPAPIAAEKGFLFVGWSDGEKVYGANGKFTVVGNVFFTAIWQKEGDVAEVTVAYDVGEHAAEQAPKATKAVPGQSIELPGAVKGATGYTFVGWSDGTRSYPAGGTYLVAADITLTAVWRAEMYTVGFALGEHAATGESAPEARSVEHGGELLLPAAPKAAVGYKFAGWSDGERTIGAGKSYRITKNVTFTAVWEANSCLLTFALGDHADGNAEPPKGLTIGYGSTTRLPAAPKAERGYRFVGWSDGEKTYGAGAEYVVRSNVAFTALWERNAAAPTEYTIENGGFESGDLSGWTWQEGTGDGQLLGAKAVSGDATFWAERIPYNKEGEYHFDGWAAKANANESHTYTLRSSTFTLGGSGYISFKMAGNAARVRVFEASEELLIAEYKNTAFRDISTTDLDAGSRLATMTTFVANLSEHIGKQLYIELCDSAADKWAVAFFDDVVTYYEQAPQVSGSYDTVSFYPGGYESGSAPKQYNIPWIAASNAFVDEEVIAENVLILGFEGNGYQEQNMNGSGSVSDLHGVLQNPLFQDAPVPAYRPSGVQGKALSFDGYSQYLNFPGEVSGRALTIDVYVCPRTFAWSAPQDPPEKHAAHVIVGSYDSAAKRGFMLGITKFGYPTFRVGTGDNWYILSFPTNTSSARLPNYEWSRLTAVFDGARGRMAMYINGVLAREMSIQSGSSIQSSNRELLVGAASEPAFEARFEITKFNGLMDELSVRTEVASAAQIAASAHELPYISYDDARLPDYLFENDWYRPQYHAAPPANWMNEPHTLFHYKDRWHLFYQYNPVGPYWRNICWGHWVSDDMVQWKYVKEAVIPTEGTITPDGVWTGNVVFDDKGQPVLLITAGNDLRPNGSNQNVGLVYAKDYNDPDLTEWRIGGYAVLQTDAMGKKGEFRDAQAFSVGDMRYMVVGGGSNDGKGMAHVFKTTANKLNDWQYMGNLFMPSNYKPEYGRVWEMPNLAPLPYEDGRLSGKYLFAFSPQHGDNDVWYYIGDFDPNTCRFTPDAGFGDARLMDFGNNVFTGPTVYVDPTTNRVLICSIMQDQRTEEDRYNAGWAFTAGLPRELFLHSDGRLGIKNIDTSSAEGEKLVSFDGLNESAANARLSSIDSDMVKIDFTISNAAGRVGLRLKNGTDGFAELYFTEDRAGINTNTINNQYQRTKGDFSGEYRRQGSTVTGTVYIDRALIEIYIDKAATISASCYGRGMGLEVFGSATFSITVTAMNGIR